jgi:hypothetical protein
VIVRFLPWKSSEVGRTLEGEEVHMTYSCPLCHLRFRWASELEGHARDDHQPPTPPESHEHVTRYTAERPRPRHVTPSM